MGPMCSASTIHCILLLVHVIVFRNPGECAVSVRTPRSHPQSCCLLLLLPLPLLCAVWPCVLGPYKNMREGLHYYYRLLPHYHHLCILHYELRITAPIVFHLPNQRGDTRHPTRRSWPIASWWHRESLIPRPQPVRSVSTSVSQSVSQSVGPSVSQSVSPSVRQSVVR